MPSFAGDSSDVAVDGVLRFEEFEGGFWALELDAAIDGLGERVVLAGYEPGPGIEDGMRVHARVRILEEQFGFLMAGTNVQVLEASPA